MWPKLLFDLLPHFARLMPVADKYLSTRSASEKAQEAALAALGESVRSEMGKAGEGNAGVLRQMQDQNARLSELAVDVARARMAVEGLESRVGRMEAGSNSLESQVRRIAKQVGILLAVGGLLCGMVVVLLVHSLLAAR